MQPASPPYRFMPLEVARAIIDEPVWHDGTAPDVISGEILCTLMALTPLFPGNYRYEVARARGELKGWNGLKLNPNKAIAEPLRLDDGSVVIAGSSIKGMLRHSLGALLSAPMERVADRHYTYRPNLGHPGRNGVRLECRPAVVVSVSPDGGEVKVDVLPHSRAGVFHRAVDRLTGYSLGTQVNATLVGVGFGHFQRDRGKKDARGKPLLFWKPDTRRLCNHKGNASDATLNHRIFSYKGGIDGSGRLAKTFHPPDANREVHKYAIVQQADYDHRQTVQIPAKVLGAYYDTQKILADNARGHISNSHPQEFDSRDVARDIRNSTVLEKNQLIYVEIEVDGRGELGEIRSLGHHYQYRWAYTSSIGFKGAKNIAQKGKNRRPELGVLQSEDGDRPKQLSGIRLLFGYVHGQGEPYIPIGKGSFQRLAGRIAINHAVSDGEPGFLDGGEGIPLWPLGEPRASAVEFYLQQPGLEQGNKLVTYGDLPGDQGGELGGRKFYLHQPSTLRKDIEARPNSDERKCQVRSDKGTLARYICDEGTAFRFAIRFARLRPWELGALLAVLEPQRVAPAGTATEYAHKLGLGRPLGLGSVKIEIKELRVRGEQETSLLKASKWIEDDAISSLRDKLPDDNKHLHHWLDLHAFVQRDRLDYPRGKESEIFNWHTELRGKYAALRRQPDADWSKVKDALEIIDAVRGAHQIPPDQS
jgi:CRISPR-associated protein (TIGR03986 family)